MEYILSSTCPLIRRVIINIKWPRGLSFNLGLRSETANIPCAGYQETYPANIKY